MADGLTIREIGADEFDLLWPIFHEIVAAGETYSYAPDMSFEQARQLWTSDGARCFVALLDGACVGGYMLHANQPGLGNHIANWGYASAMCEHSLSQAREAGFTAMQFNFVVSTNEGAVRLWRKHGFEIVGRIPNAFRHARLGLADAYVMYRAL
jgi:GNAT superfamily N-acetyltransferase